MPENASLDLSEGATPLPRGPHRLSAEDVARSQRGRMLQALVVAVARKGYAEATVADVIAGARVSRSAFYTYWPDKEAAFLDAYRRASEQLLRAVDAAAAAAPPQAALAAGLATYLGALAGSPDFARACMVEVRRAGPALQAARLEFLGEYARRLGAGGGADPRVLMGAVGGVDELVTQAIAAGRAAELPALHDAALRLQQAALQA